jgi:hypothetical protein
MDEIWSFMVGATEFMNANDWIKAHCWFGKFGPLSSGCLAQ